jgi:hypothetical protein
MKNAHAEKDQSTDYADYADLNGVWKSAKAIQNKSA